MSDILMNTLQRYSDDGDSTLGLLFMGEESTQSFFCYTLEDEHRDVKIKGETRIPSGRYELSLRQEISPMTTRYRDRFSWFEWHVILLDVPNFNYVYIHIGNTDDNTDGCILLGDGANNNIQTDGFISGSVHAFKRWYMDVHQHLISGNKSFILINDEEWITRPDRRA